MAQVHATAYVDDRAELADDVVVGPQCVIEGAVRLGPGCRLLHRVSLEGPLTAGQGNVFYPNTCIGFAPQHLNYDPAEPGAGLVIGDRNVFREGVTVNRATRDVPTTIGDENYLMVNSHVGHDVVMGSRCMLANAALIAGHVLLQDGVIFGGAAVMHQFCRVGRLAMISGLQGTNRDVPPFCTVYRTRRVGSLNLVGLRRNGYREHVADLRRAFDILYRSGHTNKVAVGRIESELGHDPLCREFAEFVKASERGVTVYGDSREPLEDIN